MRMCEKCNNKMTEVILFTSTEYSCSCEQQMVINTMTGKWKNVEFTSTGTLQKRIGHVPTPQPVVAPQQAFKVGDKLVSLQNTTVEYYEVLGYDVKSGDYTLRCANTTTEFTWSEMHYMRPYNEQVSLRCLETYLTKAEALVSFRNGNDLRRCWSTGKHVTIEAESDTEHDFGYDIGEYEENWGNCLGYKLTKQGDN